MKKLLVGAIFAFIIPLQACAQVSLWQEGKHYRVIAEKATAQTEVKEYFSFWCPACFRFEPLVQEIKKQLPEDAVFEKVHVNFMGFTSPQIQDYATTAMIIGQQLDKGQEMTEAIFNYIHVQQQGRNISSLDDFRSLFVVNGIDAAEFDKQAKGFALRSLVNKNNKAVAAQRANLDGVPNFIVNGKYQVILGSVKSAQEYIDLIVWLTKQK